MGLRRSIAVAITFIFLLGSIGATSMYGDGQGNLSTGRDFGALGRMAQAEAAELAQAPTAAKPQLSAKRIRALKKAQARAKAKAAYIKKVEKYLKKRWKGRRLYKYCRQIAEHTWKYRVSYHELARIAIAESGGGARVGYCRSHNNPFGWLDHRHYPTLLKGTKATITRMYYRGRKNEKNWNPVSVAESYAYF